MTVTLNAASWPFRTEGMLVELDRDAAIFRPPLRYLLDRKGEEVTLAADGVAVTAAIRRTDSQGYHLRFRTPLSDDAFERLRTPDATGP
ncbi:MAG: hypothetical protein INF91_01605 [Alphaproteobacteria bacterium]|nr:hypothetical protein [Alphaproteobacteria bacterium]